MNLKRIRAMKVSTNPFPPTNPAVRTISVLREQQKCDYEIFAYCSKNYEDAYKFVIKSWTDIPTMKKVTLYTDWDFKPDNDKVVVKQIFDTESSDWLVGTGRRIDAIKDFALSNKDTPKNVLFLDMDCYIVRDVSEIFTLDFDIAISRLYSGTEYSKHTATAGLWFCKLTPGFFNFIDAWFKTAQSFKDNGIGVENHKISYVQYSFTDVARTNTKAYKVMPIDEKIYNSEHSDLRLWYAMITKYKPKILHFKGRRFREEQIVKTSLTLAGVH